MWQDKSACGNLNQREKRESERNVGQKKKAEQRARERGRGGLKETDTVVR